MTALIRYHVLPETVWPAQVVRQLPPVTVETTETCLPASISAFFVDDVEGFVRRATSLQRASKTDAPSAVPGLDRDATVYRTVADRIALRTTAMSETRPGRRVSDCTKGYLCAWGIPTLPHRPAPIRDIQRRAARGRQPRPPDLDLLLHRAGAPAKQTRRGHGRLRSP